MPAKLLVPPGSAPIDDSERLVIDRLAGGLPAAYTVIANFEIAQRGHVPSEFDGVVIAPHAVYVIEIKGYSGTIEGSDHVWRINNRDVGAPFKTTNNKARMIASLLDRAGLGVRLWVEPVIILSDDQVTLRLKGSVQQHTVRLAEAIDHLRDRERLGDRVSNLKPKHEQIVQAIKQAYGSRANRARKVGDFVVESTLMQSDDYAEFLAKLADPHFNKRYRLRVFTYNPYAEPDVLERRKAQIGREAAALEQIGTHPNIAPYRQHFTDPADPNLYITVTDYVPDSRVLRDHMGATPQPVSVIASVARDIASALSAAHEQGVYHRDVRPENIEMDKDGAARLINFDYAKITGITDKTTILPRDMTAAPNPYLPPEWLDPSVPAAPSGDLYSLGMVLFEMAVGNVPFNSPADAAGSTTYTGEPNGYLPPENRLPDALNTLIASLIHADPRRRPQSASAVQKALDALDAPSKPDVPPKTTGSRHEVSIPDTTPSVFPLDYLINGKYTVQGVLDAGSSGRVYKVFDRFSGHIYALKVFNDSSMSREHVENEYKALKDISNHDHIVTIQDVIVLHDGRYAIVSEFIEGDTLAKYISPDTPIAIRTVLELIVQLLDALDHMHQRGWIHRDVKPSNIIYSSRGLRLIDFNIAARLDQVSKTQIGTPGYVPPSVFQSGWTPAADVFAAGVILYELVTGFHPYPNREITRDADRIEPTKHPTTRNLSDLFLKPLMKAVSVENGFETAAKMKEAVKSLLRRPSEWFVKDERVDEPVEIELSDWEIGKPNYNPYVTRFLRLFSQASRDNSGTRGLDSIAKLTYADTLLDSRLRDAVLSGTYRLVIITGNAGDGKTAFIQQVESEARARGAHYERRNTNAAKFTLNSIVFQTNYDGSQDEEAAVNDSVLEDFFAPFRDDAPHDSRTPIVRLIAINQGRLLDFFLDDERQGFSELTGWVAGFFNPLDEIAQPLPAWLQIVDLNQRSVTALDGQDSIFNRQIDAFVNPKFWAACESCRLKQECFIKYNVDSLRDSAGGSIVRERMRTLFEIVHLRRKLHITMRDLRSALIWMLMRDHDCDAVARVVKENDPKTRLSLLYYSAFAADGARAKDGTDDRLVELIRDIDPALVVNPALDRALYFHGTEAVPLITFEQREAIKENQFSKKRLRDLYRNIKAASGFVEVSLQFNHLLRRVVYFEGRGEGWREMTPYTTLQKFRDAAQKPEDNGAIRHAIARGISRLEGLLPDDDDHAVYIRAGNETRTRLDSFRVFPMDEFELRVPDARSRTYAEYTPERIIFAHLSGKAELVLSLDLLELLHQTADGFVLSPDVRQGIYLNYLVFRRALMHLPYTEVLLQRPNGERFRLLQDEFTMTLEPVALHANGTDEGEQT